MMSERNETAVVSGGSGSIGRVIVARLAARGLDVVVVGRNATALDALAAEVTGVRACPAELADDAAIEVISARLDRPVRMVVHSVGVPVAGGVMEAPTRALSDAFNLKVMRRSSIFRAY